jgi:hypothetical protein
MKTKHSLREAINAKCRECTHDPSDAGSAAQQIACCTITDCPLHSVRPVTTTKIPARLLETWHLSPDDLCERARPLVETSPSRSAEGRDGQIADAESETGTTLPGLEDAAA